VFLITVLFYYNICVLSFVLIKRVQVQVWYIVEEKSFQHPVGDDLT